MQLAHIHFILRPDAKGIWSVQDDCDHASFGVDKVTGVVHYPDHLRVYFTPVHKYAGSVQVTTDDDFAGALTANAGLGTQCVAIKLRAFPNVQGVDAPIDPKRIWEYLRPAKGYVKDCGNLWVNITMVND